MRKVIFISLFALTLLTIIMGAISFNNKTEKAKAALTLAKEKEQEEKNALIKKLSPENNKNQSYTDYLKHLSLTQDDVNFAIIGSSVTLGTGATSEELSWGGRLYSYFQYPLDLSNISFTNLGKWGYRANDLISDGQLDSLVESHPDLIIFETSVINSFNKNTTIDSTIDSVSSIIKTVKEKSPNSKMIIISPNPIKKNGVNKLGYTYETYLSETEDYVKSLSIPYIDSYTQINDYLKKNDLSLNTILDDELHPNDKGYEIWYGIILNYLKTKHQIN